LVGEKSPAVNPRFGEALGASVTFPLTDGEGVASASVALEEESISSVVLVAEVVPSPFVGK
jgi:hypothetical protein